MASQLRRSFAKENATGASSAWLALSHPVEGAALMSERRNLYRSPNGDAWYLGREPTDGHAFIIHQPNAPSGGRRSHIELGEFLRGGNEPEQQALLRLIGTLVARDVSGKGDA
jgi:hypothetical protein